MLGMILRYIRPAKEIELRLTVNEVAYTVVMRGMELCEPMSVQVGRIILALLNELTRVTTDLGRVVVEIRCG